MSTKIINVKVAYIRPKYNNLEEWIQDTNNVYIGRKGIVFINNERFPKKDSIWANPFKVGKDGTIDEILIKYKSYILEKIAKENLNQELKNLKGKNLGCWCFPNKCHGMILSEIINLF